MNNKQLFIRVFQNFKTAVVGLKHFAAPQLYENVEILHRPKLRIMEKVPQYASNLRPPKMQKKLMIMRGSESVHNTFLHKQFGIVAIGAGRLRSGHFEMLRLTIGRKMDVQRMFAIWRIPAPWQPISNKGLGQRMGGGKGAIDHYVTPIKSGRVILEVGGKCEFPEVKPFLDLVCAQLPFKAVVFTNEELERALKQNITEENSNRLTKKFVIQNNLCGCHKWLSITDHKFYGNCI